MELNTISALKKLNIEVIISPYEADAQLAHLCQIGYCDSVLTEDGDILVYSAICGVPFNVFYKFERTGSVQIINLGEIQVIGDTSSTELLNYNINNIDTDNDNNKNNKNSNKSDKSINNKNNDNNNNKENKENDKEEKGFTAGLKQFRGPSGRRMFAQICILAGCDYSESVYGVGLAAAQKARTVLTRTLFTIHCSLPVIFIIVITYYFVVLCFAVVCSDVV